LIADATNNVIRQIIVSTASVTTLAGHVYSWNGATNGVGTAANFDHPNGITISPDGTFALVADSDNNAIRQIILSTGAVTTLAGSGSSGDSDGVGTNAEFSFPYEITISSDGTFALIGDGNNYLIRKIIISTASVTTVVGSSGYDGYTDGFGTNVEFGGPYGIAIFPDGWSALVADYYNNVIRQIDLSTTISSTYVMTLAGSDSSGDSNGIGTNAEFFAPCDITLSSDGTYALIADERNNLIRHLVISTISVTTLAGSGNSGSSNGIGTNAEFYRLTGITISPDGTYALVAGYSNSLIRQIIISTKSVTTLSGHGDFAGFSNGFGTNAQFDSPRDLAFVPDGSYFLVADSDNSLIRKITETATKSPTFAPSVVPTFAPTLFPSVDPSTAPTFVPSVAPSVDPSMAPTFAPSVAPTLLPSVLPTTPTLFPSVDPSMAPTFAPTLFPSVDPTTFPTLFPSVATHRHSNSSSSNHGMDTNLIIGVVVGVFGLSLLCCLVMFLFKRKDKKVAGEYQVTRDIEATPQ
jgi:hypothetical protein